MGCWYQTCALTRTAIRPNKKCRLVFLAETSRHGEAVCEHFDAYSIVDTFIKGVYNDETGFIEFDSDIERAHFDAVTKRLGFEQGLAPVKYRVAMHDGHVFGKKKINFCLVSETAMEFFIEEIKSLQEEFAAKVWPVFQKAIEEMHNQPEDSVSRIIHGDFPEALFERAIRNFDKAFEDPKILSHPLRRFIGFGWGTGSQISYLTEMFPQKYEGILSRIDEFIEMWVVGEFLSDTRSMWCPQAAQGSQETNSKMQYQKLIKMIQKQIKQG